METPARQTPSRPSAKRFLLGALIFPVIAVLAIELLPAASASGTNPGPAAGAGTSRSLTPVTGCADNHWRKLVFRRRPRTCDFVRRGSRPPFAHVGLILSHAMRWQTWDRRTAFGTGRHHINMGPPMGVPIQIRLRHPRRVCGHLAFTILRARGRRNLTPPYGSWGSWGPRIKLEVCRR